MTQLLKKLPTLSLSLIFGIISNAVFACGPGLYEDDARFCLFRPAIINYPQLNAMQYSQKLFHQFSLEDFQSENATNCREWQQLTGVQVSYDDIYALQYHTSPDSFLTAYQTKNWQHFSGNSFVKWLTNKKNKNALVYFATAKAIEKTQSITDRGWGELFYNIQAESLDSLKQVCYVAFKKKQPAFLKQRYAFQFLKAAYYTYVSTLDSSKVEEVFKTIANNKDITSQWAYIYYALLQRENLKQAYFLVKAFDNCDAKKYRAFSLLSTATLDTLEKTTNDEYVKTMARAIAAMKNPGRSLEDIRFIFNRDPGNKYLPLLITREINKLEDWLLSPEVLYFHPFLDFSLSFSETYTKSNFNYDKKYLIELLDQLVHMQNSGFTQSSFINIAIVHLYNMNHQHDAAWELLSSMQEPTTEEERISFGLEKLFTMVNSQPILQTSVQNQMMSIIAKMPSQADMNSLLLYLSRKYQALGATVTAGLLHQKAGILTNEYIYSSSSEGFYGFISYFEKYASPDDIDELLRLKHNKNKTAFESFITPEIWGEDEVYYDLKGTLYIRQSDFASALKVFEKLPETFWQDTYEFRSYLPMTSVSEVEREIPFSVGNKKAYTIISKKAVVKDILEIENQLKQAKSSRQKALYTFWLANTRFNLSYYGKAWMVYAYGKTAYEPSDPRDSYRFAYYYINPSKANNTDNYYYLKDSRKLYEQALELAKGDKELSAQCLTMLSICDEIQQPFSPIENNNSFNKDPYRSPFRKELMSYQKTKFFQQLSVSCPDLTD